MALAVIIFVMLHFCYAGAVAVRDLGAELCMCLHDYMGVAYITGAVMPSGLDKDTQNKSKQKKPMSLGQHIIVIFSLSLVFVLV